MTRKRFIKMMMGAGVSKRDAEAWANYAWERGSYAAQIHGARLAAEAGQIIKQIANSVFAILLDMFDWLGKVLCGLASGMRRCADGLEAFGLAVRALNDDDADSEVQNE